VKKAMTMSLHPSALKEDKVGEEDYILIVILTSAVCIGFFFGVEDDNYSATARCQAFGSLSLSRNPEPFSEGYLKGGRLGELGW